MLFYYNVNSMRITLLVTLLLISLKGYAQSFENSWVGYFSYNNIFDITEGPDEVIAAAQNAYFKYDLSTMDLETTSSIQGLSGETISAIYYSEANDLTIIGYVNGLIEVVLDDGEIVTVVDILDKPTIPPDEKRINHFYEFEDILYISSDFGLVTKDWGRVKFLNMHNLGCRSRV